MKAIWTPEALQDRIAIWDYIASDNPYAPVQLTRVSQHGIPQNGFYPWLMDGAKTFDLCETS